MSLWRLYYHIVWGTKERHPLISPDLEPRLYHFTIAKIESLGGKVQAIGGIDDHIHLIASIPPNIAVAEFVKRLKGSSSHYLNNGLGYSIEPFNWQGGYGVFSISNNQLDKAIEYVKNQKIHHQNGTTFATLENWDDKD